MWPLMSRSRPTVSSDRNLPRQKPERLDAVLVSRGLAPSRHQALALIMAGAVRVGGEPVTRPDSRHAADAVITVAEPPRFVSRAGWKLLHALETFGVDVRGAHALDIGASTGGFTDCLLQQGAASVTALDVGSNQLAWKMRTHPAVTSIEGCNARIMTEDVAPGPFEIITMDVSFISQRLIWPQLAPRIAPGGTAITLIKPQFEAGRQQVGKGGIVRDPAVRDQVIAEMQQFVSSLPRWTLRGVTPSPIQGQDGNHEFLLCASFQKDLP